MVNFAAPYVKEKDSISAWVLCKSVLSSPCTKTQNLPVLNGISLAKNAGTAANSDASPSSYNCRKGKRDQVELNQSYQIAIRENKNKKLTANILLRTSRMFCLDFERATERIRTASKGQRIKAPTAADIADAAKMMGTSKVVASRPASPIKTRFIYSVSA